MTGVEFRLLGPIEVRIEGRPVALGYAKQRCVLASLLCDVGRVVPIERIVERVWGSEAPASAYNVIYGHIARLRRTMRDTGVWAGTDPLRRRPGGYVLDVRPDAIDLYRFRALVTAARAADDTGALPALREALDLWRGPALAGADGPWADRTRAALERERMAARLAACDVRMRSGLIDEAMLELTELAAEDPLHEGVTSRLILALHQGGHTSAALEHFALARRRLVDELGADPGPELRTVHQLILRRERTPLAVGGPL